MEQGTASAEPSGLLTAPYRTLTVGTVALVSLIAFEYLAVATAMPTVARELGGLSLYALAFGGSLAAGVVGMVASGCWSDARGPNAPVWTGAACFVAGLLIAGLAPTMWVLILGRVVQGFGAGLLSVALYVVVGRCYPAELHPGVFGAFAAAWVVPSIVGPVIAGLVAEHLGWRWVFLTMPFLAVPATLLVRPALGRVGPSTGHGGLAPGSVRQILWALGAATGAGLLHYGGQQRGESAALLVVGLAGVALFGPRLLPQGTLRAERGLPTVILLRGIAAAAFFEAEIFVPLLLSRERGYSPALAGLALTFGALTWSAGSWYQGRPHQPMSRVRLVQVGMTSIAGGIAGVALTVVPEVPAPVAILGWCVAGLGMGLVYPTLSVLTLELSTPEQRGSNSSALQLSDSLFAASTLALGGSLFAALVVRSSAAAYLACFAAALGLAVLGALMAPRMRASASERPG